MNPYLLILYRFFFFLDNWAHFEFRGLAGALGGEVEDTVGAALFAVQLAQVGVSLTVGTADRSFALGTFTRQTKHCKVVLCQSFWSTVWRPNINSPRKLRLYKQIL